MSLVKKEECNSIIKKWQIYFQVSNYKGKYFLDLNDNNNQPIHSTYSKGSTWLKHFSLSNLLYACITRLITNHTFIDEYKSRFFPNVSITCPHSNSLIEIRTYILHKCV